MYTELISRMALTHKKKARQQNSQETICDAATFLKLVLVMNNPF